HTVYGKQQRDEVLVRLAARLARANTPEQFSLESTGAVQHRQAAFEPAAVVGKTLEECAFTRDLQQAAHRAVILAFDHAGGPRTHVGVGGQGSEAPGDGEVDQRQCLFDLVDDQTKKRQRAEHLLQQLSTGASPDLHKAADRRADTVPAGNEMPVLAPAEYPGN